MNRIIRIARKIVADTTLSKYHETELKLKELQAEKKGWDDRLAKAMGLIEQFKKDIQSGAFQVEGTDQKTIEKNKRTYLKECEKPTRGDGFLGLNFADRHKEYANAKSVKDAFFDLHFYSKEPEKLQRKIDEYANKLQFMKKDLEGAIKLRDHLPPEFEKALQNVYDKIFEDCKKNKNSEVDKCRNRLNDAWDILSNPKNSQYEYWHNYFGTSLIDYFNVDIKNCSSENDYRTKVEAAAKSYLDDLTKLEGNAQGLIQYIESHPVLLNLLKRSYNYKDNEYAGDAQKAIKVVEKYKRWQIDEVCGGISRSEGALDRYKKHFQWMLDNANKINPEAQAMAFYTDMKNRFVDDLSRYCSEIVSIEDASIGIKGNIDAIVVAPNGKFKVQAVPAGGYNIQRYHYRVLINRLRS